MLEIVDAVPACLGGGAAAVSAEAAGAAGTAAVAAPLLVESETDNDDAPPALRRKGLLFELLRSSISPPPPVLLVASRRDRSASSAISTSDARLPAGRAAAAATQAAAAASGLAATTPFSFSFGNANVAIGGDAGTTAGSLLPPVDFLALNSTRPLTVVCGGLVVFFGRATWSIWGGWVRVAPLQEFPSLVDRNRQKSRQSFGFLPLSLSSQPLSPSHRRPRACPPWWGASRASP